MRPARPLRAGWSRPSETTPALTERRGGHRENPGSPRPRRPSFRRVSSSGCCCEPSTAAPNRKRNSVAKSKLRQALRTSRPAMLNTSLSLASISATSGKARPIAHARPFPPRSSRSQRKGRQPIEDRLGAEPRVDGLVMLDNQRAGQIARARRRATRDRHARRARPPPRRGSGMLRGARPPIAGPRCPSSIRPRRSSVASRSDDDCAAELGLAFDVETGRRDAERMSVRMVARLPPPLSIVLGRPTRRRAGCGLRRRSGSSSIETSKPLSPAASRLVFVGSKLAFKCRIRHTAIIFQQKFPFFCAFFN